MIPAPHAQAAEECAALPVEHHDGLSQLRALILDVARDVGAAPVQAVRIYEVEVYATPS